MQFPTKCENYRILKVTDILCISIPYQIILNPWRWKIIEKYMSNDKIFSEFIICPYHFIRFLYGFSVNSLFGLVHLPFYHELISSKSNLIMLNLYLISFSWLSIIYWIRSSLLNLFYNVTVCLQPDHRLFRSPCLLPFLSIFP